MELADVIKSIPNLAVDAVCVAVRETADSEYSIAWMNAAFCGMYATSEAQARGLDPFSLFHWDYVADFRSALQEMREGGDTSFSQDTLCLRCDGTAFWGGVSFVEVPAGNAAGSHALIFVRDIDDLKNREQSAELALIENEHLLSKLEATQTRMMSAINMTPDPFSIYDARDRLVIWNPAFADTISPTPDDLSVGMKKEKLIELAIENGFFDEAIGREEDFLSEYMSAWRKGSVFQPVTRIQGRDFKIIRSDSPNGDRVLLRVDITEQLHHQRELKSYAERLEKANDEISEQALHDELTGLGNRRYLKSRLEEFIVARAESGFEMAALHIDLDRFKQVNDTMGHTAGDHVLTVVADILRQRVRQEDVVARIGGDEFIVLMCCAASSDAPEILAERLIEEICKPIHFEGRLCRLGASVGIARTPMIAAEDLLTCSDIALYKAKTGGRAMKAVFDHADLDNMKKTKRMSDDILQSVDAEEFLPVYQPQVDLQTGEIVALEVLARWMHPELGEMRPNQFLDTAKFIHVDGKIDRLIFRKAVAECDAFFGDCQTRPSISFNVSQSRLMEAELLQEIANLQSGNRITFELVEATFLENDRQEFMERIKALRALGLAFEIDNFGSGNASIVGLRRITPERFKIERRLVEPVATSRQAAKLLKSLIDIGRALNISVTAEGVETQAQLTKLKALGCDRAQGFFISPPSTLADIFSDSASRPRSA